MYEQVACGLLFDESLAAELEVRQPRLQKSTEHPELILRAGWPALVLEGNQLRWGDPAPADWDLGLAVLDEQGNPMPISEP